MILEISLYSDIPRDDDYSDIPHDDYYSDIPRDDDFEDFNDDDDDEVDRTEHMFNFVDVLK